MGLQASGKSAFFRGRFAATHAHVSKDLFKNNRNKNRRQAQLVEEALAAGESLVVDNTNPRAEDRRPLVEAGRRHGAEVNAYYFDSPLEKCLTRNWKRAGRERVPDVALYATAKRLQAPISAEGFDRIFVVRLGDGCGFELREL